MEEGPEAPRGITCEDPCSEVGHQTLCLHKLFLPTQKTSCADWHTAQAFPMWPRVPWKSRSLCDRWVQEGAALLLTILPFAQLQRFKAVSLHVPHLTSQLDFILYSLDPVRQVLRFGWKTERLIAMFHQKFMSLEDQSHRCCAFIASDILRDRNFISEKFHMYLLMLRGIFPPSPLWRNPCIRVPHWRPKAAMSMLIPTLVNPYFFRKVIRKPNPINIITWTSLKSERRKRLSRQQLERRIPTDEGRFSWKLKGFYAHVISVAHRSILSDLPISWVFLKN